MTTVELKFHLNEPFPEITMDGRHVQTTATRNGNILILDQKGISFQQSHFLAFYLHLFLSFYLFLVFEVRKVKSSA